MSLKLVLTAFLITIVSILMLLLTPSYDDAIIIHKKSSLLVKVGTQYKELAATSVLVTC